MEHRALKTLADKHGQLLLTLGDTFPPEATVTISANGKDIGTVTATEFSQLGQEISAHRAAKAKRGK